jgi:Bacterial membrane protein YfhO
VLNLAGATFNDDYRYGYSGVGAESTFMAQRSYDVLRGLGFTASITGLQTADIGGTPLSSAVLSLGAVITPVTPPNPVTMGLPSNAPPLPATVSAQPDVAPVGYVLPARAVERIDAVHITATTDPFRLAELFLGAEPGTLARPVPVLKMHLNNIALTHPRHPRFERVDGSRGGSVTWTLDAGTGRHIYGFIGTDHPFRLALAVDDGARYDYPSPLNNGVIDLGDHVGPVRVTLRLDHFARWVPADAVFVSIDQAALRQRVTRLQADGLADVRRGAASLHAGLSSPGGMLVITIPYDSGWHVRLDSQPVGTRPVQGFMALPAPAGEHQLSMTYVQPGLRRGAVVSVACLLALIALLASDARRRRRARPAER